MVNIASLSLAMIRKATIRFVSQFLTMIKFYITLSYSSRVTHLGVAHIHTTHLTLHTSHLTLHTSRYTPHATHITLHTSRYTHHTTHLTLHTSRYTPHATHLTLHTSRYTPHATYLTLHTSRYTPHATHLTLPTSRYTHHATHLTLHTCSANTTLNDVIVTRACVGDRRVLGTISGCPRNKTSLTLTSNLCPQSAGFTASNAARTLSEYLMQSGEMKEHNSFIYLMTQ